VLIVALLHVYIGVRLLPGLPVPMIVHSLAVLWLIASTLLMPAALMARRLSTPWADQLSWVGMMAMGFFSSLLVLTIARDLFLLVTLAIGWRPPGLTGYSALGAIALALAVTVIGFFQARGLAKVKEVDVPIANLPDALHGFTIAQISDIHVGPTIKRPYIDRIVDRVNSLAPDAIAITGDLVDGSVRELSAHTAPFARLSARHGAYVVTGNHEYYSGAEAWIAELRRLGLRVLMNEHVVVERGDASLVLGGVTDFTAGASSKAIAAIRYRPWMARPGRGSTRAAGAPATHCAGCCGGGLRSATVGSYPRGTVLAVEPVRADAAALRTWAEPA
jgi:hypothetical protein